NSKVAVEYQFTKEFVDEGWKPTTYDSVRIAKALLGLAKLHGATTEALRSLESIVNGPNNNRSNEMARKKAEPEFTPTKVVNEAPEVQEAMTPKAMKKAAKKKDTAVKTKKVVAEKLPISKKAAAKKLPISKKAAVEKSPSPKKIVVEKSPNPKLPKKEGIGSTIYSLIAKGLTTSQILDAIKSKFP